MFELKSLSRDGIEGALAKAERYRLLNEPWEAESICRDVLQVDPENQRARVGLILALSDQFGTAGGRGFDEARDLIHKLAGEYERAYYTGLLCERRAKVHFERGTPGSGSMAYHWYREAMEWFEKAEALRQPGNEDAALRWNTCARMLNNYPELRPAPDETVHHMLE
jgi:tetratricopeptide (TPR) repeat protein